MTTTTETGVELVDLDDAALAPYDPRDDEPIPFDLTAKALSFAGLPPADMSRLTGFADDYQWATWLADVLRAAGCEVVEYPGWKTRGRPRSSGPFTPLGVIWHHDASAKGASPFMAEFIAERGRPPEVPAPLAQCWVALDGTWWVLAAGRANHAGTGTGWGAVGRDFGNTKTIGVETDNTSGEPTPKAMYDALVTGTAAILRHLDRQADDSLMGHKEYAPGRKIDPDDVDMNRARHDVAVDRPSWPDPTPPAKTELLPYPGPEHFTIGHKCREGWVDKVKDWLNDADPRKGTQLTGPGFTKPTERRVAEFQAAHPKRCKGSEPGDVDRKTWNALQHVARARA